MPPYVHKPLPEPEDPSDKDVTIRLLQLPPGGKIGLIYCRLITTSLSQAPEFEALSYCWDLDKSGQSVIFIDSDNAPFPKADDGSPRWQDPTAEEILPTWDPLVVPATLISFLYRTRSRAWQTRTLWIDSVCIDQTNTEEKNRQVRRMRDIYMGAKRTLIWLGPTADGSDDALKYAFELMERMRFEHAERGEHVLSPPSREDVSGVRVEVGHPSLAALMKILDRPYFERAWIVQEVVVSREAHVIIGDRSLNWIWFLGAFLYLMDKHTSIFEFYPPHRLGLIIKLRYGGREWEDRSSLEWYRLLSRHRESQSGDARDKVFAFWGLMSNEEFVRMGVGIDYKVSIEQVYWNLAVAALGNGHVEILSVPKIVPEEFDNDVDDADAGSTEPLGLTALNMPSWVPDWRTTSRTPESLLRFDALSGNNWRPPYAASSASFLPGVFESYDRSKLPDELPLKGFSIARITRLNRRPWKLNVLTGNPTFHNQARIIRFNQRQIIDWEKVIWPPGASRTIYTPTGESMLDAGYGTITAGLLLNGSVSQTKRAINRFELRQYIFRFFVFLGIHDYLWPYIIVVAVMHFLRFFGVENPEWKFRTLVPGMINRKAASLIGEEGQKGQTFLGLVPAMTRIGDTVVLCAGVKVPLVLRKKEELGGNKKWEFVGDAYVHGAMDGTMWVNNRSRLEDFTVV